MAVQQQVRSDMADATMELRLEQPDDLVDAATLKRLMHRSDARAWLQTLSHFCAIAVTGYLLYSTWGSLWTVPLFAVHGTLLAYTYAAQHEFSHLTPFRTRWLNVFWGHVCGFIGFFPHWFDRTQHMVHHQYTSIRGKDTEIEGFRPETEPFTLRSFLYTFSAIPYWLGLWQLLGLHARGRVDPLEEELFDPNDIRRFIHEARVYLAAYLLILLLSVYYGTWIAIHLWIAPMLCMKFMHHVQNYAEHYGLPKAANVMDSTRTIYTTPLNRWMVWNMTYHTAHHRFANVPFYNLPQLDRLIRSHVRHRLPGYLPFVAKLLRCAMRGERYGYEGLM